MPENVPAYRIVNGRTVTEAYLDQLTLVARDLPVLARMIELTLEIEPAAPNTYNRVMTGEPEPHQYGARYRFETFPARYARVMRQPRMRLYDLEAAEVGKVRRLLSWGGDMSDLIEVANRAHWNSYRELELDLQLNAGQTLLEVARSFGPLLSQLSTAEPPSPSQLPYQADLAYVLSPAQGLAEEFLRLRGSSQKYRRPEAEATARIMDAIEAEDSQNYWRGYEPWIATAGRIGGLAQLRAVTRAEDGSELGLAHPAAPAEGWLTWYQRILDRMRQRLGDMHATLDPAAPMVTPPAEASPPQPPGLVDPRYGYAARFVAAYEDAPVTDTDQHPSLESCRFDRAHQALGLSTSDAYELLKRQAQQLLADAGRDPGLIERTLGPAPAGQERPMGDALAAAMTWYRPPERYAELPHGPTLRAVTGSEPGSFESLQELPMNRWEVRFRYPELLDLCSRLAPGRGAAGLEAATGSFIGAREPCRVWLPPVVGELHEIVSLLPFDRDLGYAMAHLGSDGADGSDGAAWRTALRQAADDITAHIWHHEDHPDTGSR